MCKHLVFFILLFSLSSSAFSGSLWQDKGESLYSSMKNYKVGDIITVLIEETSKAAQSAGTNTYKDVNLNADLFSSWSKVGNSVGSKRDEVRNRVGIGGGDKYKGAGETSRRSHVYARVSVSVDKILPNGNLYVLGKHVVNVNDEVETITISGIIRQEDISVDNTILSAQIADAKISIKGEGPVAQKQSPGFLSKLFGWIF